MKRKLILSSIIGGSLGGAVLSVGLLFISKTRSEKLVCYLLLATFLTLCTSSIAFLKLGNSLLDASKKGDTAKVKSLLKIGVSVNTKNYYGETPLLLATEGNHVETVKLLLQHKANVNVRSRFGNTPLASAIKNGHIEIAELLLKYDADATFVAKPISNINWRNNNELEVFATENGYTKILELLLRRGIDADLKNRLLHTAVGEDCIETAKLLLAHGADVNFCSFRDTLLHLAATNGHVEMVKLLIESGANVNAIGSYDYTPLHKATQGTGLDVNSRWYRYHFDGTNGRNRGNKYRETAEFLIKNGANIDVKGVDDIRPLHLAIYSGLSEIAILFLKKGADPNLPGIVQRISFTPMGYLLLTGIDTYASARHYLETFFTLLAFGAHLTEEHTEQINENHYPYLKDCLTAFEEIKKMPHLGKIMQGYKEKNLEVISYYVNQNGRKNNIEQLTQELQNIKRSYGSNRNKSFISETLLDVIKFMVKQYMNRFRKTQFKTGALSGLICEAVHSELKEGVSLEDIVSPKVASMLSDQDAVNLSLVCKSINCKANDRIKVAQYAKNMFSQLEKAVVFADAAVGGPQVGG